MDEDADVAVDWESIIAEQQEGDKDFDDGGIFPEDLEFYVNLGSTNALVQHLRERKLFFEQRRKLAQKRLERDMKPFLQKTQEMAAMIGNVDSYERDYALALPPACLMTAIGHREVYRCDFMMDKFDELENIFNFKDCVTVQAGTDLIAIS